MQPSAIRLTRSPVLPRRTLSIGALPDQRGYFGNRLGMRRQLSGHLSRGRPAREQLQAVRAGSSGSCGVDEQGEAGVSWKLHGLEIEVEEADDRVADALMAGAVEPDIVGGPPGAEYLTAGGELTDQLDQLLVLRVAASLRTEHGSDVVGGTVPVRKELAR